MAYSDYGGYAYRNGERVVARSDATITPDGDTFGTPGMWPGIAKYAIGENAMDWPSGHVVLGDGPVLVVLYKQSTLRLFRGFEELDQLDCLAPGYEGFIDEFLDGTKYINDELGDSLGLCVFNVDDCKIEVQWEWTDNHYQYVQLTQPDGVIWVGWSGYGVGAGLEGSPYHGYSTDECEKRAEDLFPVSFQLAE